MSLRKLTNKLYDGYLMPQDFHPYKEFREAVDYEPKQNEVYVVSFPKSGTTWTQYIVWEILSDAEEPPFVNEMWFTLGAQIEMIGSKKMSDIPVQYSHRLIKSHMPFQYMPYNSNAKYIYIARNPFDVCLSYFKDVCNAPHVFGVHNFDQWVGLFVDGFTAFGDYFEHIYSWYRQRNKPNVLFITYEEMKNNPTEHVLKIADFIGDQFGQKLRKSKDLMEKILHYTSFEYMKTIPFILPKNFDVAKNTGLDVKKNLSLVDDKNYHLHTFFHVGKVGYSYGQFSQTQIQLIQNKVEEKFSKMPDLLDIWRSFGINV